jgi:hypothetical protein
LHFSIFSMIFNDFSKSHLKLEYIYTQTLEKSF